MANPVFRMAKTYPVTMWAGVGVFAYCWKLSLVSTMYRRIYSDFEVQRQQELINAAK